ncbi:MAG: hypothetical protein RIS47_1705 [Bacteroidota bacterium]|jgi:hypothetical protein
MIKNFLFVVALAFAVVSQAKTPVSVYQAGAIDQIIKALGQGDVSTISSFFPNTVAIAVLQKAPSYFSKKQAEQVLTDFFKKNAPRKFDVAHEGGQNTSQFTIGQLSTANGTYRVTFFLQDMGGKSLIQNISIDRKDD